MEILVQQRCATEELEGKLQEERQRRPVRLGLMILEAGRRHQMLGRRRAEERCDQMLDVIQSQAHGTRVLLGLDGCMVGNA